MIGAAADPHKFFKAGRRYGQAENPLLDCGGRKSETRRMSEELYIVAAGRLEGTVDELAAGLAGALGVPLFDARSRARPPAPKVLAVTSKREEAARLHAALSAAGFQPMVMPASEVQHEDARVSVRAFTPVQGAVRLEARDGRVFELRDADIRGMIRATTCVREIVTDTITTRKFNPTKALLTGGLMLTSKKKVETTRTELRTEGLLIVAAADKGTFTFRETEIQYSGLGAAMQASRFANFQTLYRQLRERAPGAFCDERMVSVAGQVHLLGPTLAPERYLDEAISLLFRWGQRNKGAEKR